MTVEKFSPRLSMKIGFLPLGCILFFLINSDQAFGQNYLETREKATICHGASRDRISVRAIRPATSYLVTPAISEIISQGDAYVFIRGSAVWKKISRRLCADIAKHYPPSDKIDQRIVIFLEGQGTDSVLAFEYPDVWAAGNGMVEGKIGQRGIRVQANDLRLLLDYGGREDAPQRSLSTLVGHSD